MYIESANLESGLSSELLIAMPSLRDTHFARSVTFVCQHGEDGAMGLQINRLSEYRLGDVLEHMNLGSDLANVIETPVLVGGPMQPERGFVLHTPGGIWESSFRITEQISVTTSRDILAAIAIGEGPLQALVALGYAGWGAGQIEQELLENSWLTTPANQQILFDTPLDERWDAAAALLGIGSAINLASYSGRA
ncbi:MAG: YqgE/AlgH family protein [Dokdonella sp.]